MLPLLFSSLLPALLAGGVLLLPLALQRVRGGTLRPAPFGGLGLGLAYLVCAPGVRGGVPELPPLEATDWVWFLAPAAVLLGWIDQRWRGVVPLTWGARLLVLGGGLLAIGRLLPGFLSGSEGWLITVLAWGVGTLLLAGLDRASEVDAEPPALLVLTVLLGGAAGVMLVANSAALAQLCAVLAAGLGAQLVLAWRQPALTPLRGTAPVLGVVFAHLLFVGHLFGYPELPALSATLLALAPAALWVSRLGPLGRRPAWQGFALALTAALVLTAGAGWLAYVPADPHPY